MLNTVGAAGNCPGSVSGTSTPGINCICTTGSNVEYTGAFDPVNNKCPDLDGLTEAELEKSEYCGWTLKSLESVTLLTIMYSHGTVHSS